MFKSIFVVFVALGMLLQSSCRNTNTMLPAAVIENKDNITGLEYIDEYILPEKDINGIPVGGLSGIDYAHGIWYLICDTSTPPIRYYEADISYTTKGFDKVNITAMKEINDASGTPLIKGIVDPESIRLDPITKTLLYSSEGSITNSVAPALIEIDQNGTQLRSFRLPEYFTPNPEFTSGPRHNGVFEGLTLSFDHLGYWINTELPLLEDGPAPTPSETTSPVRITYFDKKSGIAERQFAYELDRVARKATEGTNFEVNGLVELLTYGENKFLALERSFSSGYKDGGNTVKIYKVEASQATNTLNFDSLATTKYTTAKKTLLFDFETIRNQLTQNTIDNLEGISFGPNLEDGSKTLIVVSDNNFNTFFPQLNQFIVFRVLP